MRTYIRIAEWDISKIIFHICKWQIQIIDKNCFEYYSPKYSIQTTTMDTYLLHCHSERIWCLIFVIQHEHWIKFFSHTLSLSLLFPFSLSACEQNWFKIILLAIENIHTQTQKQGNEKSAKKDCSDYCYNLNNGLSTKRPSRSFVYAAHHQSMASYWIKWISSGSADYYIVEYMSQ